MSTTKLEWFTKNGFNEEGLTYCVIGDSYSIKEELKKNGYKYSPLLKWHAAAPIELPEGYFHIIINFYDIYEWNEELNMAYFFETSKEKIEKAFAEKEEPSNSQFVGQIGERLRNITAVYSSSRGFSGAYGYTYIHTFYSGEDCLVWFTTKELTISKGSVVDLTGTIKSHEMFRGVATTQLSRCVIKVIGE